MNTPGFLVRNWGLKLLALSLAIIIYYAVRDSIRTRPYSLKEITHVESNP